MKNKIRLARQRVLAWTVIKLIRQSVRFNANHSDLAKIHKMLNIIYVIFNRYFNTLYSVQSARFLACHFTDGKDDAFMRRMILNKLMTNYIRVFLATGNWKQVEHFLNRNCRVERVKHESKAKLLLCTHTGDYWVSILMAAREYEGTGVNFIVPVYEGITDENQAMYNRIAIAGVNIIFICIHKEGALKQIVRHIKDPGSVVAIFYDLYCYRAGIYNGSVEAVSLFDRHAHMTTGILQIAQRLKVEASFVSCHYSESHKRFETEITTPVALSPGDNTRQEMIAWLENKIRKTPWQWHFIAVLDTYYHFPFSRLQAWHTKNQEQFRRLNAKYQGHRL